MGRRKRRESHPIPEATYCKECVNRQAQLQQLEGRFQEAVKELNQSRQGTQALQLRVQQLERIDDVSARVMAEAVVSKTMRIAADLMHGLAQKIPKTT